MATLRINLEGTDNVSSNLRSAQQRLVELTRATNENKNASIGATAAERRRLRSLNEANSVLKANTSLEIRELRLKQQLINEINREARARETAARAAARQAEQSRQAALDLSAGVAMSAGLVARELGQLTAGFVRSAAEMETFRATIQAVTGDAGETNRVLQELLDLSVELVGIDTGDLIQFSARLMAAGLSAAEARDTIRGVTERVAEQGKGAAVTTRVLEQLSQAINSNQISAQDFRPILRELPTLFRDASNALGQPIQSLEDFRNAADTVGGPTQAIILLVREMARASEGADLSTLNSQLDILSDQSRVLQAELGQHLIPAIVSIVMQINEWIEAFNDLDDDAQAAIAWGAALATGLTALTAVISGTVVAVGALSASLAAITGTAGLGGVATLAGQAAGSLGRVVGILGRLGAAGNLAATAGITLAQAWNQIYNDFQRTAPFEDAVESITTFNVAASETARSLGLTAESLSGLSQEARTEFELLTERADQLRTSIRNAINRGDTEGARAFRKEYRQVNAQITELTANLPQVSTAVDTTTESVEDQTEALIAAAVAGLETRRNLENLAEGQRVLNEFWRLASGTLGEYNESIDTVIPSVVNLTQAENALTAAIETNLQTISTFTGDAQELIDTYLSLSDGLTSYAADQAIANAEARLVNPAISEAADSMRDYIVVMGMVQGEFRTTDAISDRLTDSIRDQASAFDELARSAGRAATAQQGTPANLRNQLPGQVIGSGVFDRFDARAAGYTRGAGFFDSRITGGDNTFENNLIEFRRNLENFTEGFTVNVQDVIDTVEGGITPFELFERSLIQLDPSLAILTTSVRLLGEEIEEVNRRREELRRRIGDPDRTTRSTFGRGRLTGLGSDTDFGESSGRFQTRIGGALSLFQGTAEEAIISSALNQIAGAGADRPLSANLDLLEMAYEPFIQRFQTAMDSAGESFQSAIRQELDPEVIRRRFADVQTSTTDYYDAQIRAVQAAAALSGNTARAATFELVRERDNIINQATNALRLASPSLTPGRFEAYQRVQGYQRGLQFNRPQEEIDAEYLATFAPGDPNATLPIRGGEVEEDPAVTRTRELAEQAAERISDNTLSRSIRTSTETLNDLIRAGNSVADLQAYINTELVPLWVQEYDEMVQDLVGQGHTLEDAQQIVSSEYGTSAEFTANRTSAIIDPITEANAETARQVAERVSDGSRGRAIRMATETLNDMVSAGDSVSNIQSFINTTLVPLWGEDYDDMIDDLVDQGLTLEQAQSIVSAEHGTRSEFTSGRVDAIITPITEANQAKAEQVAERISDGTRGGEIRAATETLNGLIKAGTSVADLLTFINETLVPLWGEEYQDMIGDLVTQGFTLEQATQIVEAEHGTQAEFTGNRTSAIITPITEANQATAEQAAERISDGTRGGEIRAATETLNGLIKAGTSVADLLTFINTELVPLWEQDYDDLIGDLVTQGFTLEQAEQIVSAEHGTRAEFLSGRTSAIITPITEANQATAEQVAEIVSDNQLATSIRTSTAGLQDLIKAGASVADLQSYITTELVPLWESEYQDMINDLVEQGFTLEQATQIVESQHGTRDVFISGRTDAIITPITESNEATATRVAELISDGTRGRAIRTTTGALSDLVEAGTSIAELQTYINTELVPLWRSQYQDMIDDLVAQGLTLEQAQAIVSAEHGTADEFVSGLVSDVIDPIRTSRQASATRNARASGRFDIDFARFNLGGATSEQNFNDLLIPLIQAINDFYDAEEGRIADLGLGIEETNELIAQSNLRRDQELRAANAITNEFEEDRLEKIKETQEEIDDLRQDALDNEKDRQEALVDLAEDSARRREEIEQDHLERLEDIRERAQRSREDTDINFSRDIEDILRDAGADTLLSPNELQRFLRTAQSPFATDLRSEASRLGADLSDADISRIQELARERLRDREDIQRETERRRADAQARVEQARAEEAARSEVRRAEIEQTAEANATAIQEALTPLLEQQAESPAVMAQTTAAEKQGTAAEAQTTAAEKQGTAAEAQTTAAEKQGTAAEGFTGITEKQREAAELQLMAAEELQDAARVQGLTDAALALEGSAGSLSDAAQDLSETASNFSVILESFLARLNDRLPDDPTAPLPGRTPFAAQDLSETASNFSVILESFLARLNDRLPDDPTAPLPGRTPLPDDPTAPIPVKIENNDIFDRPDRIAELREQGLNNREIGIRLREEAAMTAMTPRPIEAMAGEAVSTQTIQAMNVSITAGSVTVSGPVSGTGNEAPSRLNVDVNVKTDPKATAESTVRMIDNGVVPAPRGT